LKAHPAGSVKVFAVWEPMLVTDWRRPTSGVLARLSDARVAQFWDPEHTLARKLSGDAREPQPKEECCRRDGILWDLAAVYAPGAMWNDVLPPAVLFNGPVVEMKARLEPSVFPR